MDAPFSFDQDIENTRPSGRHARTSIPTSRKRYMIDLEEETASRKAARLEQSANAAKRRRGPANRTMSTMLHSSSGIAGRLAPLSRTSTEPLVPLTNEPQNFAQSQPSSFPCSAPTGDSSELQAWPSQVGTSSNSSDVNMYSSRQLEGFAMSQHGFSSMTNDQYPGLSAEELQELNQDPEANGTDEDILYSANANKDAQLHMNSSAELSPSQPFAFRTTQYSGPSYSAPGFNFSAALPATNNTAGDIENGRSSFSFPTSVPGSAAPTAPVQPAASQASSMPSLSGSPSIHNDDASAKPRRRLVQHTHMLLPTRFAEGEEPASSAAVDYEDNDDNNGEPDQDDSPVRHKAGKSCGFNSLKMSVSRREINDNAVMFLCGLLCIGNVWSEKADIMDLCVQAWFQAFEKLKPIRNFEGNTEPTEAELEILSNWGTTLRWRFKTAARKNVAQQFDLKRTHKGIEGGLAAMIICNRDRVAKLKDNSSYVFEDPGNRSKPGTIYCSQLLEDIIVEALYNNGKKSLGANCSDIFGDMIPMSVIALAAAAIEAAINEYGTATTYRQIFDHHFKQLMNWNTADASRQTDTLCVFRRMLMSTAHAAAGIDNESSLAEPEESRTDFSFFELC
ncbi:hypothetical protein BT96DRAFT_1023261 [Gymnopus androsaceus JB14]|uniref:DUF6532 domain-containing protein n=1 Tax=Gymnopus androsaceus JB14 TaxID=1447944 RepID=A0A6A4H444_9AGAR|nr:hypothetical protein BT96DRAFT_1023261 [Gymnopus androsaceus JB14]